MSLRTTLPFLVFILTSTVLSSVNVISDNRNEFVFEYTLGKYSIESDSIEGKSVSLIDFAESDKYSASLDGYRIPYKSFTIGVPQKGNVNVFVEPIETRVVRLQDELLKSIDTTQYMVHKGAWSTREGYVSLRDLRAVKFYLTPFNYNLKNRTLTILTKAKVTVKFPTSTKISRVRRVKKSGDYEQMIKNIVLNYNSAQDFRKDAARNLRSVSPLSTSTKMISFKVSDGISGTNETTDHENGIMKINASDISSLFGTSIPISSFAVYSANMEELSLDVPAPSEIPTGVEEVPLLRVDSNNNGLFDGNDYFLFYVSSLSDWVTVKDTIQVLGNDSTLYDSIVYRKEFNLNRIAQDRTYWILGSGGSKSISKFSYAGAPAIDTITNYWKTIRYRNVTRYLSGNSAKAETEGGINWVWDRLNEGNRYFSFDAELDYSEINTTSPGFVKLGKGYGSSDTLKLKLGDDSISLDREYVGVVAVWPDINSVNRSIFDLALTSNTSTNRSFFELAHIDLTYNSALSMRGEAKLRFFSDTALGTNVYGLNNFPVGKNYIFRIKDNGASVDLVDSIQKSSYDPTYYYWTDSTGVGVQYFACNESGFLSIPADYEVHTNSSYNLYEKKRLRGVGTSSDYLIITSDDFISQALDLAAHKVKENLFNSPVVIDVKDIYREFSGGTPDFSAIRNFLSYIHNGGWTIAPDYVLLLGSGHYDYKNYTNKGEKIHIPTTQHNQWCIEDYFSYLDYGDKILGPGVTPDLFLGRIVALTESEAASAVSKIIELEQKGSDFSDWRNKFLLVADDDKTPHGHDGITHYKSSESVADYSLLNRPALSLRKVYLFEYPWNDIGKKPGAYNALKSEIENGVGYVNYFGHGSWEAWADEDILNKDNVKSLSNSGQYPIFTAFSCRVGRFDIPGETSLAGDLVNQEKSGAIAFIASTRTAYAGANTLMAKGFYWALFNKKHKYSVGQAYTESKIEININTDLTISNEDLGQNLKYYTLIGDPSFRVNNPTDSIKVEIVSEKSDTIQALETVTVNGTIGTFDSLNEVVNSTFGTTIDDAAYAQIGFYFPIRDSVKRKDGGEDNAVTYSLPGDYVRPDTIVPVINGKFSAKIMMPKRVPFNLPEPLLRVYAWNEEGTKSAQAIRNDFIFSGSLSSEDSDTVGPSITIRPVRLDSTGAVSSKWNVPVGIGDTISAALPMMLGIDLWDASGLQLTGSTPGEGLTLELEGISEQVSIGNEFSIDPESNGTAGSVEYFIDSAGVLPGCYNVIVGAMDINGNISRKEVTLKVTQNTDFDLTNVYNYPNPAVMGRSTRFYFDHNRMMEEIGENIDATIRVYSLSGKLLKIFRNASNGQLWDLTDQQGRKLSPNVYLYTVSATMNMNTGYTEKEKKIRSDIKKLVIHPPR